MSGAPASIVIVSRDRPAALARCLTGIGQLYYHPFEVVVVTDAAGLAEVAAHPLAGRVRTVRFDAANISAARNAGIAAAGGEVVAFIDDDAVPEPSWLDHLLAPILAGMADITGGFVRGRNGISFQWRARVADPSGQAHDMAVPGPAPFRPQVPPGHAVKTEGTNMAVRRSHLLALGGFDPRIRFFLDETDLNMRSARSGGRTMLVPLAQVHHGFAASPQRRADRLPLSLHDIGASSAIFWARHAAPDQAARAEQALVAEQRRRLLRHMVAGSCEPGDVRGLLADLEAGLAAGRLRAAERPDWPEFGPPPPFEPLHAAAPGHSMTWLGGRASTAEALLAKAHDCISEGGRASVTLLERGIRRHSVSFTPEGVWLQRGGLFGRSDRDRRPRALSPEDRLRAERARVSDVRESHRPGVFLPEPP